jgi:MFS family permease
MPRFRLALQIFALLGGAAALLFIGRTGCYSAAVVLTAVYGLFRGLFEVNTHASVFDVISSRHHASVVGFMLLLAMFTGALFAGELIGRILTRFDGTNGCLIVFALMALTYLTAALLMSVSFFFTFKKDLIKKEI